MKGVILGLVGGMLIGCAMPLRVCGLECGGVVK